MMPQLFAGVIVPALAVDGLTIWCGLRKRDAARGALEVRVFATGGR